MEPDDFEIEKIISPLVLADPLNPGWYLPAAMSFKIGEWNQGTLFLGPRLATSDLKGEASDLAKAMCIKLEEEGEGCC